MFVMCHANKLFSDHHQLSIILDVLGTPTLDDFYAITSPRSREYIRALPFRKKKPFSTLFPGANPLVRSLVTTLIYPLNSHRFYFQALDLMDKCLTFSPKRRIDVDEALRHPYLEVKASDSSSVSSSRSHDHRLTMIPKTSQRRNRWTLRSSILITVKLSQKSN